MRELYSLAGMAWNPAHLFQAFWLRYDSIVLRIHALGVRKIRKHLIMAYFHVISQRKSGLSSLRMDASWLSEISVANEVQQIMSSWGQDFSIILAQMMSRLLIYYSKPKEQMTFDSINMNKSLPLFNNKRVYQIRLTSIPFYWLIWDSHFCDCLCFSL
jgi:hypothetical protein